MSCLDKGTVPQVLESLRPPLEALAVLEATRQQARLDIGYRSHRLGYYLNPKPIGDGFLQLVGLLWLLLGMYRLELCFSNCAPASPSLL